MWSYTPSQEAITDIALRTKEILAQLRRDEFTAGEISDSEYIIEGIAKMIGWHDTLSWLKQVYTDNTSDERISSGILHCLSHYTYNDMKPVGVEIAALGLQNEDNFVRHRAVRAFENWNCRTHVEVIRNLPCNEKWQRDYIDAVVRTLEEEGID